MAPHIQTIASSSIPKGSKADFYAAIQFGDIIFCQGNYDISKAIQVATRSCLPRIGFLASTKRQLLAHRRINCGQGRSRWSDFRLC